MGVDKQTGHFRGFAHVEFATDEDLERAVALNGASVLGRPMKIAYATARKAARDGEEAKGAWRAWRAWRARRARRARWASREERVTARATKRDVVRRERRLPSILRD